MWGSIDIPIIRSQKKSTCINLNPDTKPKKSRLPDLTLTLNVRRIILFQPSCAQALFWMRRRIFCRVKWGQREKMEIRLDGSWSAWRAASGPASNHGFKRRSSWGNIKPIFRITSPKNPAKTKGQRNNLRHHEGVLPEAPVNPPQFHRDMQHVKGTKYTQHNLTVYPKYHHGKTLQYLYVIGV